MTRLTVLGGSSVSTPGLVLALRDTAAQEDLKLVLWGRSPEKLATVAHACRVAATGTSMTIEVNTELVRAVDGADVILNQIRVGGLEGRRFDEQFSSALGLFGEETMGAGGFSNAVRTIPAVLDLCEVVEHNAPHAVFVNLTNPASLVHAAIEGHTALSVVSMCDIPVTLTKWVCEALTESLGAVEVDYLGMNHVGWVTGARDRNNGSHDVWPAVLANVENVSDLPFEPEWVRALGVLPGSYLRYIYHRNRYASGVQTRTRADDLLEIETAILRAYYDLPADGGPTCVAEVLNRRAPHWYWEIIAPLLTALRSPTPQRLIVQTVNRERIDWLPDSCVVEAPALVSRSGIVGEDVPELPDDCQALLVQNAAYEELAVEAIVEGNRGKALRALAINPLVGTVDGARAVLDMVWA